MGFDRLPVFGGTHANRPAAADAPFTQYVCSTHSKSYWSNGSAWADIGSASPLTTKGDLYGHDGTSDVRVPVGTDGQLLTAASGETPGVKWGDPPGAFLLGPWFENNATANQTGVALTLLDGVRETRRVTSDGTITKLEVDSNESRTAGTLTVELTVNGTGSGLTATLDATNTDYDIATGSVAVSAGDVLGIEVTTDSSWAPATADISASVQLGTVVASGGGGGGGGLTLIERTVVGAGGAADIDFTSISGDYEDLIIAIQGRTDSSATVAAVFLEFNSDSGANYSYVRHLVLDTNHAGFESFGASYVQIGLIPGTSADATYTAPAEAEVLSYARTTFYKSVLARTGWRASSSSLGLQQFSGQWASTAAITEARLFPAAGSFVEGTVASLYGRS